MNLEWLLRPALLVAAATLLVACTGQPDVTSTAAAAPHTSSGQPVELASRSDLDAAQPATWTRWEATGERDLLFTISAGPPECTAARTRVQENSTEVAVRIEVGTIPGSGDCAAIAEEARVRVTLAAPLGKRTVRPL